MLDAGALQADVLKDARWFFEGACLGRRQSGLQGLLLSRPLLEGVVRKWLFQTPNVKAVENTVVEGLLHHQGRVTGVRMAQGNLDANLVVDASGRGSHSPQWLSEMGFAQPAEEHVEVKLAYTTRLFRRCAGDLEGDTAVIVPATPDGKRAGAMLAQEGDRWTVTLIGYAGQVAPAELPGFLEFAKSLPTPDIHDVVRRAEPLGDAFSARFPHSQRRRYERLKSFPAGFLVFGDAICSFNPIYGQGMSVSALQAAALDETLGAGSENLARRFFERASKVVDTPWSIAVGADLRIPETVGPRNAGVNFINWYISKLHKTAHRDPEASVAFLKVANLLAPPPSILHPRTAFRVLRNSIVT